MDLITVRRVVREKLAALMGEIERDDTLNKQDPTLFMALMLGEIAGAIEHIDGNARATEIVRAIYMDLLGRADRAGEEREGVSRAATKVPGFLMFHV